MTEDMLPLQILGAVAVGVLLGPLTRLLRWPPLAVAGIATAAYIALWYVVGYSMVGWPESIAKLIAGSLLVLPGLLGFFGIPLCGAFAASWWLTPARDR